MPSQEEDETPSIFKEDSPEKTNQLKGEGQMVINPSIEEAPANFEIIERDDADELTSSEPM